MNNSKFLFFIVFGIYHVVVLLLAYYINSQQEDIALLGQGDYAVGLLKQITFVGLFLFLANFGWSWYADWVNRKKEKDLRAEVDQIKAKMYDMQKEPSDADLDVESDPDQDQD